MKHNFIDRYSLHDSPLHILEARSKLLAIAALIIAILCIPSGSDFLFFIYFLVTAILMGISQIPLGYIITRTAAILPLILILGLLASWNGWAGLASLFIRAALCLILLIILINTTRFMELLRGLRRLGCPQVLVKKLDYLYHYLFALSEEAGRMWQARACRHLDHVPFRDELKMLRSMLKTLRIRSLERTERMKHAMLSRGFSSSYAVFSPRRLSWRDLIFLPAVALFITATFMLGIG